MANRGQHSHATSPAPGSSGIGVGPPPATHPGLLRTFQSAPSASGLAAKRNRPNFNIRDILGPDGARDAGLGQGVPRPINVAQPRKPSMTANPFSNFDKIVYVVYISYT